ncbi:MAG: hypothetical protein Q4G33_09970 [bacterium]|nr:hypothetical protein [bacterium]
MALITINGTALPEPSSYDAKIVDLVDNGRNAYGTFVGNVIRSNVASVEAKWLYLSAAEWSEILQLIKSDFTPSVTFYDMASGTWVTRTMYPGDRTGAMCQFDPYTHNIRGWQNCRLLLSEV